MHAIVASNLTEHQDHNVSTQALRDAIAAFPSIVPLLADKADISLPGEVRSDPAFKIVLGVMYVVLVMTGKPGY